MNPLPHPFNTTCFTAAEVFTQEECNEFIGMLQNPIHINTTSNKQTNNDGEEILRIVERTSLKLC
eukprot:TRINITY_DN34940_c0_g1_i1.p1 TRINITY_DN34940_c0_g1~~TRINITY_DN34940_c0_g1_i1.p1  ORF type:complete len:65 (+),score=8.25 TRINITY_DN34940_c0_g1_i1:25-219(+)